MEDIKGQLERVEKELERKEKELREAKEAGDEADVSFLRQEIIALRQEEVLLLEMQLLDKKLMSGLSRPTSGRPLLSAEPLFSQIEFPKGTGYQLEKLICCALYTGKRSREEDTGDIEQRPRQILKPCVHLCLERINT